MSESRCDELATRLRRLGSELEEWSREHRDASLAEQERAVLELVRAVLPALLGAVLPLCTSALSLPEAGLRQLCPKCGKRQGVQSWRKRTVATVCGPVQFERPYYYCPGCKGGWAPADTSLGLERSQQVSAGLREWLADLGATAVFREASRLLRKFTGLEAAPETVRQHTEGVGAELEQAQQAAMVQVEGSQEAAEPVERAPGLLVIETDGVMVRYTDGWHEVKLGLVGGHQDGHTGALSYVAARESAAVFGPRLLAEAARRGALEVIGWEGPVTGRGLAELRPVAVVGDGAHWIWNLAADYFGVRTEIVDFYHASEHVWEVAHAIFKPESPEAKVWAEARLQELYEQGAGPVLKALVKAKPATAEAAKLVRRERGYFRTNHERMAYPQFREQGLPIGSGGVESAAKHVVQLRMKRPGARWSEAGAQRVLTVRTRLSSRRQLVPTEGRTAA